MMLVDVKILANSGFAQSGFEQPNPGVLSICEDINFLSGNSPAHMHLADIWSMSVHTYACLPIVFHDGYKE